MESIYVHLTSGNMLAQDLLLFFHCLGIAIASTVVVSCFYLPFY